LFALSVTGGKGGTGKSFVAVNLAYHLSKRFSPKGLRIVLADLDVEAPNDHILLGLEKLAGEKEIEIYFPKIDYSKCTSCGACVKVCDTGAIVMGPGKPPFVFPRLCSGCKACYYACPYKAIAADSKRVLGYSYETAVKIDEAVFTLVTGILREGEEHTPPAVVNAKRRALSLNPDILVVDTGAGTGNAVSAAIQGSNLVVAVTEPTPLGAHDLEAILKVTKGMGYPTWVVINRWGIGPEDEVLELARNYGVERVFKIPYSKGAVEAYVSGTPLLAYNPNDPAARGLLELAEAVSSVISDVLGR
jgi:MinD superfamily P-loop ATPase